MFKFVVFAAVVALVAARPQKVQQYSTAEAGAEIKSFQSDISPDGSYRYSYETSNGIVAQEAGVGGQQAQGAFAYNSPEGAPIQVTYTADANGFHPEGAHLPVAPPIPEAIIRSIEWNAAHPEEGRVEYVAAPAGAVAYKKRS